jgi:hypothetical protein
MNADALKNVLGKLDLVAMLLRNRPPLPSGREAMREELRALLARSAIHMSSRELTVLCSLLAQRHGIAQRGQQHGVEY